jgi:hypothetical protein
VALKFPRLWSIPVRAGGLAAATTAVTLAVVGGTADVAKVRASASGSCGAVCAPEHTIDHATLENATLRNWWLLPDGVTGWIRYDFVRPTAIRGVRLLNTQNGAAADHATTDYRLELVGPSGQTQVRSGVLPHYPAWREEKVDGFVATALVFRVDGFLGKGGGLNEIRVTGESAGALGRHRVGLLALAVGLVAAALAWLFPRPIAFVFVTPRLVLGLSIWTLVLGGAVWLRYATSVSALEWGLVFDVHELDSWSKIFAFFRELVVPIPPALAFVEAVAFKWTGNNDFMIRVLYKAFIVGSGVACLLLVYPRVGRMFVVLALSLIIIQATAIIHPANPQVYDVAVPFFLLWCFVLLRWLELARGRYARYSLVGAAGISLAAWGLVRPIAFFIVPLLAVAVVVRLRRRSRRAAAAFLLPLALFFGTWHLQLWVRHHQLTMSNHAGFNLMNTWGMVPWPADLEPEPSAPPIRGFNNPVHGRNSGRLQMAVLKYVVRHPLEAAAHTGDQLAEFARPPTAVSLSPDPAQADKDLGPYRFVVHALMLLLPFGLLADVVRRIVERRKRGSQNAEEPGLWCRALLCWAAGALILLFAVGEAAEQHRFVLSVAPLLTLVPWFFLDALIASVRARRTSA